MTGPSNQPHPTNGFAAFERMSKELLREERRPRVTSASDLLGPGFAPWAVQVQNWSGEVARRNGLFYGLEGAEASPEAGAKFLGVTVASTDGHAMQLLVSHGMMDPGPERVYVRSMHTHANQIPEFTAWTPVGVPVGGVVEWPATAPLPQGWLWCDGATYQVSAYPALGRLMRLSATSATFAVPNVAPSSGLRKVIKA